MEGYAQTGNEPPNVVMIVIDDLGWMDLGVQGSTFYETPNIDQLAHEGIRFTNAYSNAPVCSPSRCKPDDWEISSKSGFYRSYNTPRLASIS